MSKIAADIDADKKYLKGLTKGQLIEIIFRLHHKLKELEPLAQKAIDDSWAKTRWGL